jgi:hypothetical protein
MEAVVPLVTSVRIVLERTCDAIQAVVDRITVAAVIVFF